ncbi:MAG: YncE family protein, partial [Bradymonadia bacterium]
FDRSVATGHISSFSTSGQVDPESSVVTGMLSGQMVVSKKAIEGEEILMLPTRDSDQLEVFGLKDNDGTVSVVRRQILTTFGDLPFATGPMSTLATGLYFLVGHTTERIISAWVMDENSGDIRFGCSINLPTGVHFMAQHPTTQEIYITSRSSRSIAVLSLEPAGWQGDPSSRACRIGINRFIDSGSAGTHSIAFSKNGGQMYVTSIADGTLTQYDTRLAENNQPADLPVRRTWVGPEAGIVKLSPYDDLIYLAITDSQELLQIAPFTLSTLGRLLLDGRPYDFDFMPGNNNSQRIVLSLFADHRIAFVDVAGNSLTEGQIMEGTE